MIKTTLKKNETKSFVLFTSRGQRIACSAYKNENFFRRISYYPFNRRTKRNLFFANKKLTYWDRRKIALHLAYLEEQTQFSNCAYDLFFWLGGQSQSYSEFKVTCEMIQSFLMDHDLKKSEKYLFSNFVSLATHPKIVFALRKHIIATKYQQGRFAPAPGTYVPSKLTCRPLVIKDFYVAPEAISEKLYRRFQHWWGLYSIDDDYWDVAQGRRVYKKRLLPFLLKSVKKVVNFFWK